VCSSDLAVDDGAEGALIDGEEEVALLDIAAFLEMDLLDVAGDAGADFDGFGGDEASGELIPFIDLGRGGESDGDDWRGTGGGGGRGRAATVEEPCGEGGQEGEESGRLHAETGRTEHRWEGWADVGLCLGL
jgi:hypothetical protein